MASSKKVDQAVADLLTRVARTGLSDQEVHARAGLPNGWLSQARAGRYGPGAASVKKLRRFIERLEKGTEAADEATAAKASRAPVAAAAPSAAASDLVERVTTAKTARAIDQVARALSRAMLLGTVDLDVGEAVLSVMKERRQLIKARREEHAQAQVRALRILTPAEVALLRAHRADLAGPPLKPGEAAPPPIEGERP